MIFRIVDDETGAIVLSVDQPDPTTAALYLKPGQSLFLGGDQLMVDETKLRVEAGVIVRKYEGGADDAPLPGEGDELTLVLITPEGDDHGPDQN
ncbi:MAG: hypothetical protein ACN4EU_16515 [Brevundimonas mediterranea]